MKRSNTPIARVPGFGMKGVIAEAHYDGGRNMVAMLKGAKRYILSPPKDCERLSIIKEKVGS